MNSTQELVRKALARNPEDHRQSTDRFGAEWGKKRIVEKGTLYEKHYASTIEDMEPIKQYESIGQREQTILNAKRWAAKKYAELNQDDISQEIEIKAWQLEDHELNERGEWERPAYVMTALKNAVHDYARQEIGYQAANKITGEVIVRTRFDAPAVDEDIVFTQKTLKAGLLLFVAAPSSLTVMTKDRLYSVYKQLTAAEHKALLQTVVAPTKVSTITLDRVVRKYLDNINKY